MSEIEVKRELILVTQRYNPYSNKWTTIRYYDVVTEEPYIECAQK